MPIYRVFHLAPGDGWRSCDELQDAVMGATLGGKVEAAITAGLYREVAHVECETIDRVFPLTNHIDHDWTTNEAVLLNAERCRSTSVGDLVLDEAMDLHACASFGWRQLDAGHRGVFLAKLEGAVPTLETGSSQDISL